MQEFPVDVVEPAGSMDSFPPNALVRNWDIRLLRLSIIVLCSMKCKRFRGVGETLCRFGGSLVIVLSVLTCTAGTEMTVPCALTDSL